MPPTLKEQNLLIIDEITIVCFQYGANSALLELCILTSTKKVPAISNGALVTCGGAAAVTNREALISTVILAVSDFKDLLIFLIGGFSETGNPGSSVRELLAC